MAVIIPILQIRKLESQIVDISFAFLKVLCFSLPGTVVAA